MQQTSVQQLCDNSYIELFFDIRKYFGGLVDCLGKKQYNGRLIHDKKATKMVVVVHQVYVVFSLKNPPIKSNIYVKK